MTRTACTSFSCCNVFLGLQIRCFAVCIMVNLKTSWKTDLSPTAGIFFITLRLNIWKDVEMWIFIGKNSFLTMFHITIIRNMETSCKTALSPMKSRQLFSQTSSNIDVWLGSKYVSKKFINKKGFFRDTAQ